MFIGILLLHFIRNLWIKERIIYVKYITFIVLISGWILFILSMIEGFLGYILCWGQMSYWGITVMINIIAIVPLSGAHIAELFWSSSWVISNRIFVYHFIIGMVISIFIFLHIFLLHNYSSSNPFTNNSTVIIPLYPFIFKDLFSCFATIIIIFSVLFHWEPDILGNSENQIVANPLTTPNNILPEWYYLLFHSCPRSFPDKTIGVIIVTNILIMNVRYVIYFGYSGYLTLYILVIFNIE